MSDLDSFYKNERKKAALKIKSQSFKKRLLKKLRYKSFFDPRIKYPEIKFVIYTRGRTGSTMLSNLLDCHPDIFCDGEIFNFSYCFTKIHFPKLYIQSCSKTATLANKKVYGFKVKISQLLHEHKYKNHAKILNDLSRDGWKFIYLKRENYLKHQLSNIVASETKVFLLKKSDETGIQKAKVNCNDLLDGIIYAEEVNRTEEENLEDISHIKISYEKDLLDNSRHQQTADKIFNYLGVSSHPVTTEYKKVTSDNLSDTILNYEEVYNFFKNTKYADFLK